MAIHTTYTHARVKLSSLLDEVTKNREVVIRLLSSLDKVKKASGRPQTIDDLRS